MKDNQRDKLSTQDLMEIRRGISGAPFKQPLYSIGAKLYKRNNPSCFGSVIDMYCESGQWIYRIMGSETKPKDIAESELKLK